MFEFLNKDLWKIWEALQNLNIGQNPTTATIDITGKTVIDMTVAEGADIVILTSANATETINTIINNLSNKEIIFRPAGGLAVTFKSKSAVVGSNMSLYAEEQIANGTKLGFLQVRKRTTYSPLSPLIPIVGFFQTNFIDEYFS